ncbi:MAG: NAD-dependent epimerase/dehydratase family protein [Gemmatimonadaceae bacterium]
MTESTPSYLITGATGFLGRHIVAAIRRDDPSARIIALVRNISTARGAELGYLKGATLLEGSPAGGSWADDPALQDLRGVYHLAAEVKHSRVRPEPMTAFNVNATLEIVRLGARRHCRVVFVSTSGTIGCSRDPEGAPDEESPHCVEVAKDWPYYLSKIRAEKEASALAAELGVELVIVRPPVLLGPGDHRLRSVGNLMRVLDGRLPFIWDGGINFVDVRDAADAMVRAMQIASPRPSYNLPGTASSLDDFFRRVARLAGIQPSWRIVPSRFVRHLAALNDRIGRPLGIIPDKVVIEMASHFWGISSRYAEADLGFRPRDPDVTAVDTIAWIRQSRSRMVSDRAKKSATARDHTVIARTEEFQSRQSRG